MINKTRRRRNGRKSLVAHQTLEPRKMLAGDVGVSLDGDALTFTGSHSADTVEIVQTGDSVSISGLNGTTINGATGPFVVQTGAQKLSYRGSLRGGDDAVAIQGLDTTGSVRIFGNNGDDSISVSNSQIDRVFGLFGGRGNDDIEISDVNVGRLQIVNGGAGTDSLALAGDNSAARQRLISIEDTTGEDEAANVIGLSVDGGNVTISGSEGNDGFIIRGVPGGIEVILSRVTGNVFEDGTTSRIIPLGPDGLESLNLNLNGGNDGVFISGIDADVLNVDGGDGVDAITVRNSNFSSTNFTDFEIVR